MEDARQKTRGTFVTQLSVWVHILSQLASEHMKYSREATVSPLKDVIHTLLPHNTLNDSNTVHSLKGFPSKEADYKLFDILIFTPNYL